MSKLGIRRSLLCSRSSSVCLQLLFCPPIEGGGVLNDGARHQLRGRWTLRCPWAGCGEDTAKVGARATASLSILTLAHAAWECVAGASLCFRSCVPHMHLIDDVFNELPPLQTITSVVGGAGLQDSRDL